MSSAEQHYSLRWNDYTVKIVTAFQALRDEEDFIDVTVACDGHSYPAHKMVLSACSPYFRTLLKANPCKHPIVILKDVGHMELERLLEFMYNGEVNIAQDHLAAFLKTAENLKIRGLAGSSEDLDQIQRKDATPGVVASIGVASEKSSPSYICGSSGKLDDSDLASYTLRSDSPPTKRRKRSANITGSSQSDTNAASHATGTLIGEERAVVDVETSRVVTTGVVTSAANSLDSLEDEVKLDQREPKSEPNDTLADVYSGDAASELGASDPQQQQVTDGLDSRLPVMYPVAMPGTSGNLASSQQDLNTSEPGDDGVTVLKREPSPNSEELWWVEQPASPKSDHTSWRYLTSHQQNQSLLHLEGLTQAALLDGSFDDGDVQHYLPHVPGTRLNRVTDIRRASLETSPCYPCDMCDKTFRTAVTLSRHKKIHLGNAFHCPYCPKVFYQKSNIKYHVRAVHRKSYDNSNLVASVSNC